MSDKPEQPEIVRSPLQAQRAHDVLALVVGSNEIQDAVLGDGPDRDVTFKSMRSVLDAFCWLLGHDNDVFAENMLSLEAALKAHGYGVYDAGRLVWPGEDGDGPLPS